MFLAKSLFALLFVMASTSASIYNSSDPSPREICSLLPPNKYILRPHTCTDWVKCPSQTDLTDFEDGACAVGLYYNKNDGRCAFEESVQCPYNAVQKNRCAQKEDGAFLVDPESKNCRGYLYCSNGKELRNKCPSGLLFDPKQAACVYETDYKCPTNISKPNTSPICRSIANHQFFANEEDCTQYFECSDDGIIAHECDLDMAFHHVMGRCVPKENVVCHPTARKPLPDSKICGVDGKPREGYVADTQSCSGYYICAKQADNKADRHPKRMQCENGLFFDEAKWSCRDRVNVRCTLDRCEGMDNKYVNVAGDCTAYARCSNGVSVATGTCAANYFFDEKTQGCTPQNINYIACAPESNN